MLNKPSARNGYTLIGTVITAGIAFLSFIVFQRLFLNQSQNMRNIAGRAGTNDLSHGLNLLFNGSQCDSMDESQFSFEGTSPVYVTLGRECPSRMAYCLSIDTFRFSSGAVALTNQADPIFSGMIRPFSIASNGAPRPGIQMTALGGEGVGPRGKTFPFQLNINWELGNQMGPSPIRKFITIYTDASNKVVGACQAKIFRKCPAGYSMVGEPPEADAYCISTVMESATTWKNAMSACVGKSPQAHLCSLPEWENACLSPVGGSLSMTGQWEWTSALINNFAQGMYSVVLNGSNGCSRWGHSGLVPGPSCESGCNDGGGCLENVPCGIHGFRCCTTPE